MKKIIDFTLEQMLKNDELKTVEMLREVITEIIKEFGDITDVTKEKYNNKPDGEYEIKISISTIRNYLKPYRYVVKKDTKECIVREMSFSEYAEMRQMFCKNKNTKKEVSVENKSVAEILAMNFIATSELFKQQKMMSIRCASSVQERLDTLCKKNPMFTKQYLLSLIMHMSLESLGE